MMSKIDLGEAADALAEVYHKLVTAQERILELFDEALVKVERLAEKEDNEVSKKGTTKFFVCKKPKFAPNSRLEWTRYRIKAEDNYDLFEAFVSKNWVAITTSPLAKTPEEGEGAEIAFLYHREVEQLRDLCNLLLKKHPEWASDKLLCAISVWRQ